MNIFKRLKLDSVLPREYSENEIKKIKKRKDSSKKLKTGRRALVVELVDTGREASDENYFWVLNGPALRSISDLCEAIPEMTDEQFYHHTKRNGSDFANWIEDIFQEEGLAKKIRRLKTRKSIVSAIKRVSQ